MYRNRILFSIIMLAGLLAAACAPTANEPVVSDDPEVVVYRSPT
jgi:hypothetical protein